MACCFEVSDDSSYTGKGPIDTKVDKAPPTQTGSSGKIPPGKNPTYQGPDGNGPGWMDYLAFLGKGGESFFRRQDKDATGTPYAGGYLLNPTYHVN